MLPVTALLVVLVLLVHKLKDKRHSMIAYKNKHSLSVVVAVRFAHPDLDRLLELAKASPHQFTFININGSLPSEMNPGHRILDLDIEIDPRDPENIIRILSEAYKLGYPMCEHERMLFIDANVIIKRQFLDFIANNLVEHQLFTVTEWVERSLEEGYLMFNDWFMSHNCIGDSLNYHFFAVKDDTYRLSSCHDRVFDKSADIEAELFRKNISVLHLDHGQTISYTRGATDFKSLTKSAIAEIRGRDRLPGLRSMLLTLLAFHAFYVAIALYPTLLAVGLYLLVHAAFWIIIRDHASHHPLSFVLTPFYMLWFDVVLIVGLLSRLRNRSKRNRYLLEKIRQSREEEDDDETVSPPEKTPES